MADAHDYAEGVIDRAEFILRGHRRLGIRPHRPSEILTLFVLEQMLAVFVRYGATNVRIFGSVASGTDRAGSDIDLVATFPEDFSAFSLVGLIEELEEVTGTRVDVVSDDPRAGDAMVAINKTATPLLP